ncbi:TPA: VapC toxin family PIN domain ribonuclease [Candidatus Azambacteria bacterium]|nr:VapC toxin family PIN domain ribonuclease [Candidatus Azambacteria bacterium]
MKGYCVDSDILIDYLRGQNKAREFLLSASKEQALWISIVSVVEIFSGKETADTQKRAQIEAFLGNFSVIGLSYEIAKRAGELRRDYGRPFADMIIAASVLEFDLSLVTRNAKHFDKLKDLNTTKPY